MFDQRRIKTLKAIKCSTKVMSKHPNCFDHEKDARDQKHVPVP